MSNPQKNPNLYDRAYKAAWLQNAFLMLLWNVTNTKDEKTGKHAFAYVDSQINKTFSLEVPSSLQADGFRSLELNVEFGTFIPTSSADATNSTKLPNPYHITEANFTNISKQTSPIIHPGCCHILILI